MYTGHQPTASFKGYLTNESQNQFHRLPMKNPKQQLQTTVNYELQPNIPMTTRHKKPQILNQTQTEKQLDSQLYAKKITHKTSS